MEEAIKPAIAGLPFRIDDPEPANVAFVILMVLANEPRLLSPDGTTKPEKIWKRVRLDQGRDSKSVVGIPACAC
jgi:hypothetical protein